MSDHTVQQESKSLLSGTVGIIFFLIVPFALIVMMGVIGAAFIKGGGHRDAPPAAVSVASRPVKPGAEPAVATLEPVTLQITAGDSLAFNTKKLEAKAGQEVTIDFKHTGALPKIAMGHNVVILNQGEEITTFGLKCMSAVATDYVPTDEETLKQIVAQTALIGGGEESKITFTAPAAGEYPFLCTFPGHNTVMNGILLITE